MEWAAYGAIGLVVVLTLVSLRSTKRKLRDRGGSPTAYAREQVARLRDQGHIKDSMEELLVQLEQLARQINAQIDTRFAKLEESIRCADERIAQLRRLEQACGSRSSVDLIIDDDHPADLPDTAADPAGFPQQDPSPSGPPPVHLSQHQQVYELADAGLSTVEVARRVGQSTGEIELILSLRRSAASLQKLK